MQFQFDANQTFQLDAVAAVADLFDGQPRSELQLSFGQLTAAVPNRLDLSEAELLENLQRVQKRSFPSVDPAVTDTYHGDDELATLSGLATDGERGPEIVTFPNFSVEMETGTGKTYVYIRTALELFRRYGFCKFIVVVPSVAIREGVLKTFAITRDHFSRLFGNMPYRYYGYSSTSLTQIRQFALSESIEFMVMTLQAFRNADVNVIHQSTDRLQGETPIHLVQATRPILILDEPQNMESEASIAALALLNPLFALRYSATHRVPYNVVYRLTPAAAYRNGLVKRVEVASALEVGHAARPYIRLIAVTAKKRTLVARLELLILHPNGEIAKEIKPVKPGAILGLVTGLPLYDGYIVDEINAGEGFVSFTNTEEVRADQPLGDAQHAIFEAQITQTIHEHLRKQTALLKQGVKVLSLFFIDRVDNYVDPDSGIIRQIFERAFEDARPRFPDWAQHAPAALNSLPPDWRQLAPSQVCAAYFAARRTRAGETIFEDSRTGTSLKDRDAYELIMRDKERLLSFEEPVSFLFTHSALREGWDNPNVFQICTLNQSVSDMRKRQEIGRGMRLCVNHAGERVIGEQWNVLTVIANESYDDYVRRLQTEIDEDYRAEVEQRFGKPIDQLTKAERDKVYREYGDIFPPAPVDARKRAKVHLRTSAVQDPLFADLWQHIAQKTRYTVQIDTDRLVAEVIAALKSITVEPPRIAVTKARVDLNTVGAFEAWQMSASRTLVSLAGRYPLPNLLAHMTQLLGRATPPLVLTRRTLLRIISEAPNPDEMLENPLEWGRQAVAIIRRLLSQQLIGGIRYHRIDEWYRLDTLDREVESWLDRIVPADNFVYDGVIADSQVERQFAKDMDHRLDVASAIKLPDWFKVPTPVGAYNPDWAFALRDLAADDPNAPFVWMVAETKGPQFPEKAHSEFERMKTHCGCVHFSQALGIPYKVLSTAAEVPAQSVLLAAPDDCHYP